MPELARLDRSKPHKLVTDFVSGRRTYHQGGQAFTEGGMAVLSAEAVRGKYLCPKCDYNTLDAAALVAHATKVHHAGEDLIEVLKVYVKNIDRDLPADEGIDWRELRITPTPAQTAMDELEANAAKPKDAPKDAVAAPAAFTCASCPSTFKTQQALAAHKRRHLPRP